MLNYYLLDKWRNFTDILYISGDIIFSFVEFKILGSFAPSKQSWPLAVAITHFRTHGGVSESSPQPDVVCNLVFHVFAD